MAQSGATIAIIGGGISGLSAAWELHQAGAQIVLFEAGPRPGGVISTELAGGFLLEHGAEAFLSVKPAASRLAEQLGLGGELIPNLASPAGARIWHAGRLPTLPQGWRLIEPGRLGPVLRSPLFSPAAKLGMALRWRHDGLPEVGEESIAAHLRRRWGTTAGGEIGARVAGPMMAGVYGGSVEALSYETIRPRASHAGARNPAGTPTRPGSIFTTLRRGMGSLVTGLASPLPPGSLRTRSAVRSVGRLPGRGGYRLRLGNGDGFEAAGVIVALPGWAAAEVLGALDDRLSDMLASFSYGSSVSVNLMYNEAPALPSGSGFLVAAEGGMRMKACTFAHQKFAGRAPQGSALLRVFFGERMDDDGEAVGRARDELRQTLGIKQTPAGYRLHRHERAMPQYNVGHNAKLEQVRQALAAHPAMALAGNLYQGPGVPDCIESGRAAARTLLEQIR